MPKTPAVKTATLQIRCGPRFKAEMQRWASEYEMSTSEFVLHAVRSFMQQTEQEIGDDLDAAERHARGQADAAQGGQKLEIANLISGDPDGHRELEDKLDESLRKHTGARSPTAGM